MVVDSATLLGSVSKVQMEEGQGKEWAEAQKIEVSVDLVDAAKKELRFLETINNYPCLSEGPVLERAIYRYNVFWLPMLAKHSESPLVEGPLVVPLDCEWVWHCHRLNPVQYAFDCKKLYGKILDNTNGVSSLEGACKKQTQMAWAKLYQEECYEIDFDVASIGDVAKKFVGHGNCSKYDLASAVERQSTFFNKLSNCHIRDDGFLEEAVARYKGFLYLLKKEKEKTIAYVPTRDIDLIWHTHQLHPVAYFKDMMILFNRVLQHDDTFSDQSKRQLDVGFYKVRTHWVTTFGTTYLRDGATPHSKRSKLSGNIAKSHQCDDESIGSEEASRCYCIIEYAAHGFAENEEASRCYCIIEYAAQGYAGNEEASQCKCLFEHAARGFAENEEASPCKASRCKCSFEYVTYGFAENVEASRCKCMV